MYLLVASIFIFWLFSYYKCSFPGLLLYTWLSSFSTQCETEVEYRRSQNELTLFMSRKETQAVLPMKCIQSIIELQSSLASKQSKLAGHVRSRLKCTMDASSNSPVESNNNMVKHTGPKVNSTVKLSTSMNRIVDGIQNRIARCESAATRELGTVIFYIHLIFYWPSILRGTTICILLHFRTSI